MKKHKRPPVILLSVLFIAMVFLTLSATMLIIGSVVFILIHTGIIKKGFLPSPAISFTVFLGFVSIIVGTVLSGFVCHIPLKPINRIINAMNSLAEGDYNTRIYLGSDNRYNTRLSESFNKLADELQNTEMLRSDFINDFSHEFKTPIVSIRGFAKLIKKGNLSQEEKSEYLDIIIDESERLADMATNVLNLTKIENQHILTNLTEYNLSEQLRNCILLLEKKWSRKNINISVNFNEYNIKANEELLKQVWINLLDNAVKFADENGDIEITIKKNDDMLDVSVFNSGSCIKDDDKKRIFNKFYQGDTSHSKEGTGTGLAIVKKIAELHKGSVTADNKSGGVIFTVSLPAE